VATSAFGIAIQKAQQLVAEREGFAGAVESPVLSLAVFPEPRASDVVNVGGPVRVGDQPTDSNALIIVDVLSAHGRLLGGETQQGFRGPMKASR